jgi:inhibitor of cysteine peptidase
MILISLMVCGLASIPNGPIKVTGSDSGKTVEMNIGGYLDLVLEGNPTTGYTWDAASKMSPVLKQAKEPEFKPKSKLIGSGGEFIFHYKAVKSGKTELKFAYHRPWEKQAPARTFDLKVTVK